MGIDQTETGVTTTPWSVQRAAGYTLASGTVFGSQPQFQHDTLGRLVDLDDGFELAFDELDRLVGVTHASGSLVEGYLYDAAGRLVGFYDDEGLLRQLAYDGDQAIAAYDTVEQPGGGWALEPRWEAVWGPGLDELIEWRPLGAPTNERFVPLLDHRRSVIGAWRGDDAALAALDGAPASERYVGLGRTRRYDEHGRLSLLAPDGAAECDESTGVLCTLDADEVPFGFVGALRSPVTGLVHMRNRWYSPRLGQFVSHDPLGFVDSYDLYAYVAMDPVNGWDPWGLQTKGFADGGGGQSEPDFWLPEDRGVLIGEVARRLKSPLGENLTALKKASDREVAKAYDTIGEWADAYAAANQWLEGKYSWALQAVGVESAVGQAVVIAILPGPEDAVLGPLGKARKVAKAVDAVVDGADALKDAGRLIDDVVEEAAEAAAKKAPKAVDPVKRRVKPRKATRQQVEANQPRNAAGEMIDPNTREPLKPGQIDLGHKPGQEWRKRKEMHRQRGSTRKEVLDAENDPDLYQLEDRSSNRSHRFEEK